MTTGIVHDQNMEKQIDRNMRGCMAGFFNIFDRNPVLSGKRLYPRRLTPSIAVESPSGSASSIGSPALSREFERTNPQELTKLIASPEKPTTPPPDALIRSPVAMSSFELKDGIKSPWKFTRETPRLSLDSRLHPRGIKTTLPSAGAVRCDGACDDESERQRRSPSVVARLMGLGTLPSSNSGVRDLPEKKVELRRSASESRSRDLLHCRFTDGDIFPENLQYQSTSGFATPNNSRDNNTGGRDLNNKNIDKFNVNGRAFDRGYNSRSANPEPAMKPRRMLTQQQLRKGLYDFGDFFPEPKPAVSSIYDDIEKRLKMRGIDEPSKDLETLKQILEALQLKGLLHHSKPLTVPASQIGGRNFVYEQRFAYERSPIVVMKPARSQRRLTSEPSPPQFHSRTPPRRNVPVTGGDSFSSQSPRRERTTRTSISPGRSDNRSTSPAVARRKTTNFETQRRAKETPTTEPRRTSPVRSPRMANRRIDQTASQSPRRQRSTVESRGGQAEDESSTISESSFSTSSHTDTERSKIEDSYKDGKSLLERCDKLLHSIAEMTSATTNIIELQPSPVSVLDSSFYKEESSPSPVMKRTIDFKEMEDEIWSPSSSLEAFEDNEENDHQHQDPDFAYVSEIIRASNYFQDDSDVFQLLEKQQSIKRKNTSNTSKLQRKLIFDTINEILDRNRQLPPWKSPSCGSNLRDVWSELQRIQKRDESEDMFEVICNVMKRDLTQDSINGWGECQLEISDAVLDIERLIFKDLIGETIGDLATFAGKTAPRRKLLF